MSTSIDQAFIKQYEAEVKDAYDRRGSKLRGTVRTQNNVEGSSAVFQKVGKGSAKPKTRHGDVPTMNIDHSNVECILSDQYAGEWVDKLDTLKTNIDEKGVIVRAGSRALGRKTDSVIIDALNTVSSSSQIIADANTGMTYDKALQAIEGLGNNDVFEEGEVVCAVGWKQWRELMAINEFVNADYVGDDLALKKPATQHKFWLGVLWMPISDSTDPKTGEKFGLPIDTDDIRSCFMFHMDAVGHAVGMDVTSDMQWYAHKASWFVNNMMSMGACLIDEIGVQRIDCDETPD